MATPVFHTCQGARMKVEVRVGRDLGQPARICARSMRTAPEEVRVQSREDRDVGFGLAEPPAVPIRRGAGCPLPVVLLCKVPTGHLACRASVHRPPYLKNQLASDTSDTGRKSYPNRARDALTGSHIVPMPTPPSLLGNVVVSLPAAAGGGALSHLPNHHLTGGAGKAGW